ncbi:hypothetical protein DN068_07395 [Taibaiella soli]|uniref:Uncharacterized protein n=1 Tax=Taibaiella soli TaxID=1649169 RepID=A0A2W2AIY9_9BACT|nr:hypothetical protein DN068_07395 [Taibaiella soli]
MQAQPLMPDMIGITQGGMNVITWTCQYDGIKSIAMQRSQDSSHNFATIGYVKDLKKGPQAFIDGHPNPGKNWYRLYIVFSSDLTWYSNNLKLMVDSAQLLHQKVLPPNDSLQRYASKVRTSGDFTAGDVSTTVTTASGMTATMAAAPSGTTTPAGTTTGATATNPASPTKPKSTAPVIKVPTIGGDAVDPSVYIKSQYVFTNPFTGHVNIEIPEAKKHMYSISFFDQKDRRIFEIPRISEPSIIVDKRNFQKKGLYKFELLKDKEKLETGYITIY